MGKMKRKLRIQFNEDARREYLCGFKKRKKERKKAVVSKKMQEEKEKRKEFRKQKKAEIEKQLEKYGLVDKNDVSQKSEVQDSETSEHKEYIHHPQHVVIVDLQPDLSGLLSTSLQNPLSEYEPGNKKKMLSKARKKQQINSVVQS